jgi:long-chain fatty acid transport protein
LKTINLNPTFSARINDQLSVGVGFDAMWSELTIKQFYPWFMFGGGLPDGEAKLKGGGIGLGGNIGITWNMTDRHRLAVTYRSPIHVDYGGDFEISQFPAAGTPPGTSSRSDFSTGVKFPTIVALGYGIQLTDTIRIEADVEWLQFSNFEALNLDIGGNGALFPSTNIPQDWDDTFTAGIGGDWRFAPGWVLRTGYQFYESPVPDHTFSPTIPDADQHVFTVGLGYTYKSHTLEAAYGADFYDSREITTNQNPAFVGNYDITVHLFSFAYRYAF